MNINKIRLQNKTKYYIVNLENYDKEDECLDEVARILHQGADIVQIKEHYKNANKTVKIGKRIRELCSIYNALLIINDRIDIALIIEADGIHLEEKSIDIKTAREYFENGIIGITCSNIEQITNAEKNNADYLILNKDVLNIKNIKIPFFTENEGKNRQIHYI